MERHVTLMEYSLICVTCEAKGITDSCKHRSGEIPEYHDRETYHKLEELEELKELIADITDERLKHGLKDIMNNVLNRPPSPLT